jgi:hypothetical protein
MIARSVAGVSNMDRNQLTEKLLAKINARACSMACAIVLICGGMYMCFSGLIATGSIDLKTAIFEGRIQTGSLGLFSMFLGVLIVITLNLGKPYGGQVIKLNINGNEVVGKGLSFRKVRELVQAAADRSDANGTKR